MIFIFSGPGAGQLYWGLVSHRLREKFPRFEELNDKHVYLSVFWVLGLWGKLLAGALLLKETQESNLILGYLNVLVAYMLYLALILTYAFVGIFGAL
jgi:hypothetical protein